VSLESATVIQTRQKRLFLFSFLAVPLILMTVLLYYPLVQLFRISVTNWDGYSPTSDFVGLANYLQIFSESPNVWKSLGNNALYFIIHLAMIPVEVFIAFLLDRVVKRAGGFKIMILLPYVINGVAVSYMFSNMFSPEIGAMDMLLNALGMPELKAGWLTDPNVVNFTLVFVSVWRFSGFHIVLFLAAMQSIPNDLYEAATIDGAGPMRTFRSIVLPNILLTIEIVLFLNMRGALQVFDIPFVMTNGGPGFASSTFTFFTIKTAFNFNSFGLAAAMAIILFLIIIMLAQIQNLILKRGNGK
jgi:ABC-type sugar transport system permease subunit